MRNFVNEEFGAVWDMEELVDTLKSTKPQMCPYFASNRIMTSDADIIFCPYNYLIGTFSSHVSTHGVLQIPLFAIRPMFTSTTAS